MVYTKNKEIVSRIVHKHDTAANWENAKNFIPMKGEIIVYDIDTTHEHERFKIGDGVTLVNDLPFQVDISDFEDYKVKQAVVVDPIVNGDALAFIDSISQDEMGVITVTKKNVGKASTAGTADQLASLTVTLTGDVTGTQTIENGNNVSIVTDLSETGVTAGAYGTDGKTLTYGDTFTVPNFSVDTEGRLTAAANKTFTLPAPVDINGKMDKVNPTGTGSFSLNRLADSEIGDYSFTEGHNTIASGYASHTEGKETVASGYTSHAEGEKTVASGMSSHAEGCSTFAIGIESHAEGHNAVSYDHYSHAEGYGIITNITITGGASATTYTLASSNNQIKIGQVIEYNGTFSKITAYDSSVPSITVLATLSTEALSSASARIYQLAASGYASHAEGYLTIASGRRSHAEGRETTASGNNSHAEGWNTIASSENQHVQGKHNIEDANKTYSHIVGNGTSDSARSNAHTLDWSGNAWFAGDVYVGSTSGTNKDDGSKKLVTVEEVNELISSGGSDTTITIKTWTAADMV